MRHPTSRFVSALRSQQIDGLLRQIVEASLPPARRRVSNEARTMIAGELRGYLRARARLAVRDNSRRIAAAHHLDGTFAEQLVEPALERTVHLLVRELNDKPPLILPTYEAPRRAAA